MVIRSFVVACLMLLMASASHSAAQERTPLEGVWQIVSVAFDGQVHQSGDTDTVLTFRGNTYTQAVDGTINERGTVKIDQTQKPMTIDFNIIESSGQNMTQLGVAEVEGETLKLHVNRGTPTRPTDFNALPDNFLIVARKN